MLAGVQFQTDPSQATLTYFLVEGEVSKTPPHFSQKRRGTRFRTTPSGKHRMKIHTYLEGEMGETFVLWGLSESAAASLETSFEKTCARCAA